jgi:hypothetical protein
LLARLALLPDPRPHSSGTDAVRAALSRLFEGFAVHRGMPERVHVELIGEVWIEPLVREGRRRRAAAPEIARSPPSSRKQIRRGLVIGFFVRAVAGAAR